MEGTVRSRIAWIGWSPASSARCAAHAPRMTSPRPVWAGGSSMVEAAGIEPASERSSAESPTSVSDLLWNVLARVAPVGGISARQPYCVSSSALGRGFGPACVCMAPGSVPHRRGPVRRHRLLLGGESHLLVGRCTVPTFLTRRESPACTLWFSPPVETCTPPVGRVVDRAPRSPVPMRYRPLRLRTGCRRRCRRRH